MRASSGSREMAAKRDGIGASELQFLAVMPASQGAALCLRNYFASDTFTAWPGYCALWAAAPFLAPSYEV